MEPQMLEAYIEQGISKISYKECFKWRIKKYFSCRKIWDNCLWWENRGDCFENLFWVDKFVAGIVINRRRRAEIVWEVSGEFEKLRFKIGERNDLGGLSVVDEITHNQK